MVGRRAGVWRRPPWVVSKCGRGQDWVSVRVHRRCQPNLLTPVPVLAAADPSSSCARPGREHKHSGLNNISCQANLCSQEKTFPIVPTIISKSRYHFCWKFFFNYQICLFSMLASNSVFSHGASTCLGKIFQARSQFTWDLVGFITYNKATEASALFPAITFITLSAFMYWFCNFHLSSKYDGSSLVCYSDGRGKQQLAWLSQRQSRSRTNTKWRPTANRGPAFKYIAGQTTSLKWSINTLISLSFQFLCLSWHARHFKVSNNFTMAMNTSQN